MILGRALMKRQLTPVGTLASTANDPGDLNQQRIVSSIGDRLMERGPRFTASYHQRVQCLQCHIRRRDQIAKTVCVLYQLFVQRCFGRLGIWRFADRLKAVVMRRAITSKLSFGGQAWSGS
jgi:hypothetical protein